ncbi:MAG: hypothetical protein K2K45_09965 [Muribaculaceae bacterium]|nr:hypothetical protein [Muribaculaceae bacterium]
MATIPCFFTFDNNYALAAAVCIDSMLRHSNPIHEYRLYVVHTNLHARYQHWLEEVVGRYSNAMIEFLDASAYDVGWERMAQKSHFSKEVYYKMTAAEMFPEYDRMLFSDVDVIFTGDISPAYFDYADDDFYFAGVPFVFESGTFAQYAGRFTADEIATLRRYEISAGFMLLNLKKIRRDGIQAQLENTFHANLHRLVLPEQECIALCCAPRLLPLDPKYVVCAHYYNFDPETVEFNPDVIPTREKGQQMLRDMLRDVVQLHYPGPDKPWLTPFSPRYRQWLRACRQAGQTWRYIALQPRFLAQKLRRYSLRRFIGKIINKITPKE